MIQRQPKDKDDDTALLGPIRWMYAMFEHCYGESKSAVQKVKVVPGERSGGKPPTPFAMEEQNKTRVE